MVTFLRNKICLVGVFFFSFQLISFEAHSEYQYRPAENLIATYSLVFGSDAEKRAFMDIARKVQESIFSDPEEALKLLKDQSVRFSEKNQQVLLYFEAKLLSAQSDYDQAKLVSEKIIPGDRAVFNADVLVLRARISKYLDDYNSAIDFFLKAKGVYEEENDQIGLITIYVNLTEYFRALRKYSEAEEYIQMAKDLITEATPVSLRIYQLNREAAVYNESGKLAEALEVSHHTIALSRQTNNRFVEASGYNELASINHKMGRFDKVIPQLKKAIDIWKETGHERYWTSAVANLARSLIDIGHDEEALEVLLSAVQTAEHKEWHAVLYSYYDLLANIKTSQGFPEEALAYLEAARDAYQADFETRMNERLSIQQAEMRLQKEKERNLLLSKQIKLIHRTQWQGGIIFLMLIFLVIFLVFFLRRTGEQKKQLEISYSRLQELLKERDVLMKEVHHRVKNNLQVVSGLLELQSFEVKGENVHVLTDARLRIGSIAKIHEHLYQRANKGEVDFGDYMISLTKEIQSSLRKDNQHIQIEIEEIKIIIDLDQAISLGLIVNELITNSFKHAFKNSKEGCIRIALREDKCSYQFKYRDSGVGVDHEIAMNKGTLGMRLITQLSKQLKGEFAFENDDGFIFKLDFPKLTRE